MDLTLQVLPSTVTVDWSLKPVPFIWRRFPPPVEPLAGLIASAVSEKVAWVLEFMVARPFPSTLTVKEYVPAGFRPAVHVSWVDDAEVTVQRVVAMRTMLSEGVSLKPVPSITMAELELASMALTTGVASADHSKVQLEQAVAMPFIETATLRIMAI